MDLENIKAQMRKGILEYCILAIVSENEVYSSDILDKLKEANLIVVEGTLYPLLTRLKNDGILNYRWIESTQGPPRKYYMLTDKGKIFLKELFKEWNELLYSVNKCTQQMLRFN
jgi:PadR family transcriptional regulator PadR